MFRLQRDSQAAVQEAHWLFEHIDATLVDSGGTWLAGGTLPTLADIAMYTYTAHAPEGGISLDAYSALRLWLAPARRGASRVPADGGFGRRLAVRRRGMTAQST